MAHRGERVISRKAIAQGMSDVLRFTCMLMRALFVHVAHEIAGAARIRHSLRPLTIEGVRTTCKPRAHCVARMRNCICRLATKQSILSLLGEMDCFAGSQ